MNKYLITSPDFYTQTPSVFRSILNAQLKKHKPHYVLYRDKENYHYDTLAKCFIDLCSSYDGIKTFIHSKVDVAKSVNATGVHLTSTQLNEVEYAKSLGLKVIVSTHTLWEMLQAQPKGANMATYSPIFSTPNKDNPKGYEELYKIVELVDIPVIALGGILTSTHIEKIKKSKAKGFASIRYFIN